MSQNKQKAIVLLGFSSSYSSVTALSLQSVTHHNNKVFDKKQQDSASSGEDGSSSSNTRSSGDSNNEGNSNNNNNNRNNNQGTNDGNNPGADDNLQSADTDQQQQRQQQGGGENVAPIDTSRPIPTPQTACEQGSNCTDQQGLSDLDRSSTTSSAGTSGQDNNTPFVLPFP